MVRSLKQLYISNKTSASVIKLGVMCVGVARVLKCLKEDLAWATDKQLYGIGNLKQLYLYH